MAESTTKQTIAQAQFASIQGRRQASAETQVARFLQQQQAKLEGVTSETTHPFLESGD